MLLVHGCTTSTPSPTLEQRDIACTVKGETPLALWQRFSDLDDQKIADDERLKGPGGPKAPGLCNVAPVSNPQSASGWLVLNPSTGLPTGALAPSNATCMSGTSKCKYPGTSCQTGTTKKCKHSIYEGTWTTPQPCTCTCNY